MNSRDQSDAIWISRQQDSKYSPAAGPTGIGSKSFSSGGFRGQSSFDFGTTNNPSSNPRFGFSRSMSVNSEGASTASSSNSPPYSPIDIGSRKGLNFGGGGGGRFRTSSFSAGYGPSYNGTDYGADGSDPYLIHSPLSTSAPGKGDARSFRRSNSISVGALEHSHNNGLNSNVQRKTLGQPPLGPIDEYHKMASFGDAFKRSMDHLFSSTKIQAVGNGRFGGSETGSPSSTAALSSMKEKKQNQMKDRVVSMLCESAIR